MEDKNKMLNIIIFLLFFISSLLVTIVMVFINNNSNFWSITLLPICYTLIILLCYKSFFKITSSISMLLIIAGYYIRMIILPIVYVLSKYSSLNLSNNYFPYVTKAVFLMIYEFFMVMFFCAIFIRKKNNTQVKQKIKVDNLFSKKNMLYKLLILLLILGVLLYFYPQFLSYFRLIFTSDIEKINIYNLNLNNMTKYIPSVVYWSGLLLINILQVLLPIAVVKKIIGLKVNDNIKFFLSLCVVLVTILICTTQIARSFIIALALIIMLVQIYPKQRKKIYFLAIFVGIPVIFYALFLYCGVFYGNKGLVASMAKISNILHAYFSGVSNVATAFLIPNSMNFEIFINDILRSLPYICHFFVDRTMTSTLFNEAMQSNGQIIPMISQSMYYFGIILSPIIPVASVQLSLYYENKYNLISDDIYNKYLYLILCIYCAISPIIYNFTILFSAILGFIPYRLIVGATKK